MHGPSMAKPLPPRKWVTYHVIFFPTFSVECHESSSFLKYYLILLLPTQQFTLLVLVFMDGMNETTLTGRTNITNMRNLTLTGGVSISVLSDSCVACFCKKAEQINFTAPLHTYFDSLVFTSIMLSPVLLCTNLNHMHNLCLKMDLPYFFPK